MQLEERTSDCSETRAVRGNRNGAQVLGGTEGWMAAPQLGAWTVLKTHTEALREEMPGWLGCKVRKEGRRGRRKGERGEGKEEKETRRTKC